MITALCQDYRALPGFPFVTNNSSERDTLFLVLGGGLLIILIFICTESFKCALSLQHTLVQYCGSTTCNVLAKLVVSNYRVKFGMTKQLFRFVQEYRNPRTSCRNIAKH